jgi:hypothetical protein
MIFNNTYFYLYLYRDNIINILSWSIIILSILLILCKMFRIYTPNAISWAVHVAPIGGLIIALVAAIVAWQTWYDSNRTEAVKAADIIRIKLRESIDENARAAITLITLNKYTLRAIARSLPITIDTCSKKDHFDHLVENCNRISAQNSNKLRFSLVKELNEYENFVSALNREIIKCELVMDIIERIVKDSSFKTLEDFAVEYDTFASVAEDNKFASYARVKESDSWGILRIFRRDAAEIFDDFKGRGQEPNNPSNFCPQYRALRAIRKTR